MFKCFLVTTCLLRAFSSEPKILSVQILGGEASNQEYKISIVKSKNRFCQATLLPISGQFFFIPFQFRGQRGGGAERRLLNTLTGGLQWVVIFELASRIFMWILLV